METMNPRNLARITKKLLEIDSDKLVFEDEELYRELDKLIDEGLSKPKLYPAHENIQDYNSYDLLEQFKYWVDCYFNNDIVNIQYYTLELINLAKKFEREVIHIEHKYISQD